jgi:SpoVK/Ycf46/Vps4 family AAA+-type ATPase
MPFGEGPAPNSIDWIEGYPDTAVLCCRDGAAMLRTGRPVLSVVAERLTVSARRRMWQKILPGFALDQVSPLAIYGIEPAKAAELASDLECISRLEERPATAQDLASALRSRIPLSRSAGVKLIRPSAEWKDLVLPRVKEEQLRDAVSRLAHQERVLDVWGFLKGRTGSRGVRMLFSGPPGTGKTFAAEVLAKELGVDLLLVDISRVVSKWVGETEKNLANVFDTAERAQAVCFFDEADALFGRRTEVSDAHDRYANLETAYLLSRLERFEGLAILATNLRQNIDPAFLRRLEYVVDFDEPDREERFRIWECHIPDSGLLAEDVNLYEFAALYPVAGGLIRNAAVSAAFLAAANGGEITRHHLLRAVRAEYHKSGRPFPGLPPGTHL